MKSAIEELILDNCTFIENIKPTKEYLKLVEQTNKIYLQLKEQLTEEQFELVDEIINNHIAMEAEAVDHHMVKGIKAGLRLCAESFIDE